MFYNIISYYWETKNIRCIIATLISLGLLVLSEVVFLFLMLNFLKLDPITIGGKSGIVMIASLLTDVPLIIFFIIGYVKKLLLLILIV